MKLLIIATIATLATLYLTERAHRIRAERLAWKCSEIVEQQQKMLLYYDQEINGIFKK